MTVRPWCPNTKESNAHFVLGFRCEHSAIQVTEQSLTHDSPPGLEYAGECVADALGLNDSQYQWAIDEYMRRQEEVYSRPPKSLGTWIGMDWALGAGRQGEQ